MSAESRKLEEAKRRLDDIRRKKEELLRAKGLTSTATAEHDVSASYRPNTVACSCVPLR